MTKVILYIACSLDGYIADEEGKLDWLPKPEGTEDFGYSEFLEGIDVNLFGRMTYEQVLDFGEWPYHNKRNYVFSRSKL